MSATTHPTDLESREYECGHCGGSHTPAETVAGAFCSSECHRAHRREKRANQLWRELEQDHRFCATCGRQLKEVERPGSKTLVIPPSLHDEDWGNASDVLVGYQHRTRHAETGEISLDVDDDRGGPDLDLEHPRAVQYDRPIVEDGVATGTVCRCGNTDHRHEEAAIREREPFAVAYWLLVAARTLREEDKHDVRLDRRAMIDAVLERESHRDAIAQAVKLE